MGKGPGTSFSNQIINKDKQEVALGKQNVRPACLKDELKFTFFRVPLLTHLLWHVQH